MHQLTKDETLTLINYIHTQPTYEQDGSRLFVTTPVNNELLAFLKTLGITQDDLHPYIEPNEHTLDLYAWFHNERQFDTHMRSHDPYAVLYDTTNETPTFRVITPHNAVILEDTDNPQTDRNRHIWYRNEHDHIYWFNLQSIDKYETTQHVIKLTNQQHTHFTNLFNVHNS